LKKDCGKTIFRFVSVLIWILIYEAVSIIVGKSLLVPRIGEIISVLLKLSMEFEFWHAVFFSLLRVSAGFVFAVIIGTILAIFSYFSKAIYNFLYPAISVIRSVPVASFIILVTLWIESGYVPAFISFLMVMPVVWANVTEGMYQTDKKLLEMSEVFEFSIIKKIRMIYIPQIIPYFRTACITGQGLAWKSGIAAEVISRPNFSIGRKVAESKIYLETPELFAWTIMVIILSIGAEKLFKYAFKKILKTR